MEPINLNGFQFTYQDNGEWIWKAVPFKRKVIAEKPHLKAVEDIELAYKRLFDRMLANIVKDSTRYLMGNE